MICVEEGVMKKKTNSGDSQTILLVEGIPKSIKKSGRSFVTNETQTVGFLVPIKGMTWDAPSIFGIVKELHSKFGDEEIAEVRNAVRKFTCASFKSLLQKIIRFCPKSVDITEFGDKQKIFPADFVLSVVLAELLLSSGSFVPDIQRFVSGLGNEMNSDSAHTLFRISGKKALCYLF